MARRSRSWRSPAPTREDSAAWRSWRTSDPTWPSTPTARGCSARPCLAVPRLGWINRHAGGLPDYPRRGAGVVGPVRPRERSVAVSLPLRWQRRSTVGRFCGSTKRPWTTLTPSPGCLEPVVWTTLSPDSGRRSMSSNGVREDEPEHDLRVDLTACSGYSHEAREDSSSRAAGTFDRSEPSGIGNRAVITSRAWLRGRRFIRAVGVPRAANLRSIIQSGEGVVAREGSRQEVTTTRCGRRSESSTSSPASRAQAHIT